MKQPETQQSEFVETATHGEQDALGRAVQQQEKNRTWWQTLRRDPWLLLWAGVMLWTLIVRGFENQASGSVISVPVFKEKFGKINVEGSYFIETEWQSALGGGATGASIIGSIVGSWLADKYGIKPVVIGASCINIISVGIEFASTSVAMFFGGKMLNFVAIGIYLTTCTSYVSDIAPLAIRATLIGFCNLSQCIGPFIAAIMVNFTSSWETDWAWKSLVATQWGFAAVGLLGQLCMPESPVYLVGKGKAEDARKVLERMYSDPQDAEAHLERITLTLREAETQDSMSYLDCFKGTHLRRTMISVFVFMSEAMSGLGFISNYGALMYQYLGISDAKSFQLQIGGQILSISGALIALLLSDFIGRRPMFIAGCAGLAGLLLCMAISGSVSTSAAVTASVGFYTMFNFFYNVGVGSTVYAIAGEIPTSILRAKTLAIALSTSNALNTFWSFVSPFMFNPGYGNLKAKIGFVFGAIMLIFVVLAYFYVPETKMRSYEELDELFMNRVPSRQFKKHVTVAEQRAAEAYNDKHGLKGEEKTNV